MPGRKLIKNRKWTNKQTEVVKTNRSGKTKTNKKTNKKWRWNWDWRVVKWMG